MNIQLTYENKEYTLEYNKASVKALEAQGFAIQEIESKPLTMIPLLFRGAFAMHHSGVKRKITDAIFDAIADKAAFIGALGEMYADVINSVMDTESGNVTWVRNE